MVHYIATKALKGQWIKRIPWSRVFTKRSEECGCLWNSLPLMEYTGTSSYSKHPSVDLILTCLNFVHSFTLYWRSILTLWRLNFIWIVFKNELPPHREHILHYKDQSANAVSVNYCVNHSKHTVTTLCA